MKTPSASPSLTLSCAFEQFIEASSFARRTRESYAEDLASLLAECGQSPITALTADVIQAFLARQESLASATYNRRLAALRSFTGWLRAQGWEASALLDGIERKPEGKRAAHYSRTCLKRQEDVRHGIAQLIRAKPCRIEVPLPPAPNGESSADW